MNLEPGDIVLCTVERIERTTVFVKIHYEGKDVDGSIITSEISPGRIRNIRDFVVPKKKIVCKVLRVSQSGNIELSLRRVTQKERKEILEQVKQEKSYEQIVKSVLGDKTKKIIEEISKKERVYDFFTEAKQNSKRLEKYFSKGDSKKIFEILSMQRQKKIIIKREMNIKSFKPNGLELIKKLLSNTKGVEIKYLSAGKYSIKTESEDAKKADRIIRNLSENLEKEGKKQDIVVSIKEK